MEWLPLIGDFPVYFQALVFLPLVLFLLSGVAFLLTIDRKGDAPFLVAYCSGFYLIFVMPVLALAGLFLYGMWSWPLDSWPIFLQALALFPLASVWVATLGLFAEQERLPEIGIEATVVWVVLAPPLALGYVLLMGIWVWPLWAYLLLAAVLAPSLLGFLIATLFRKRAFGENIGILSVIYFIGSILFAVPLATCLLSGSLWGIASLPAALFLLAMLFGFRGGVGGGVAPPSPLSLINVISGH